MLQTYQQLQNVYDFQSDVTA